MVKAISIIGSFHDRLYSQGNIDLLVNFIFDSMELIEKEHLWDDRKEVDQYGFAGYLRSTSDKSVNNPLVLKYINKVFGQFEEVTSLCDQVESLFKRYDPVFWERMSEFCWTSLSEASKRDCSKSCYGIIIGSYLQRFIPPNDIVRVLK